MALRGALMHRKTRKLARLLAIDPCCALGVMEGLWHVTAALTPNGAIGRLGNDEIADQLGWSRCPDALVTAMVDAGFLDDSRAHRLIIHNWHQRSDNTLDAQLYRRGERYANGSIPRGVKLGSAEKAELFEKFYKQPAASLFSPVNEAAEEIVTAEAASVASNLIQFVPAPHGAAKRLPEPEPVPVPVPANPLPPADRRGSKRAMRRAMEQARETPVGQQLHHASQHVVMALRLTGTYGLRAQVAIVTAIDAECKRVDKPPEVAAVEVAERMVTSWTEYLRNEHLLRFKWQPPKFFGGGYWADDRTWPWDQQLIAQQRNATVGMR